MTEKAHEGGPEIYSGIERRWCVYCRSDRPFRQLQSTAQVLSCDVCGGQWSLEAKGQEAIDIEDVPRPPACRHITGRVPKSVSIVAMGPSQRIWHNGNGSYDLAIPRSDEVWALNKGLRTLKCDVGFVLDDLVGEARKSAEYHRDLQTFAGLPIITTTIDQPVRELFPRNKLHAYPLQAIVWDIGVRFAVAHGLDIQEVIHNPAAVFRIGEANANYLRNSVPMMLAYALWIGVKKVFLYGVDYTYPGQEAREEGRANAEYWVGLVRGMGMEVQVCSDSTLLDTRNPGPLYGYGARPPLMRHPSQKEIADILIHLGVINADQVDITP